MISVFIPTYNSANSIARTIECILSQTYQDLEICIVDDCSTDDTIRILDSISAKDSRVRYIQKEKNGGFVPDSWNRVFTMLRGEFTFYLSHDDLLSSDCLERLVNTQKATGADCVIPEVVFCKGEIDKEMLQDGESAEKPLILDPRTAFARMLNYDIPGFALWRTELIRRVGMPTEAFNSDEAMQRIWALNSNRVVIDKAARFYYLIARDGITTGLKPYHLAGLKTQQRLLKTAFSHGIWCRFPKETLRFLWQYLRSYRYLKFKAKL